MAEHSRSAGVAASALAPPPDRSLSRAAARCDNRMESLRFLGRRLAEEARVGKHTRTPRGTHRRQAAFEKRATTHHEFIGESDADRAEAEFRKHEHREDEAVRQMASEFESLAEKGDGAMGPEIPFRIPRSVGEVKDTMEKLREKAE